MRGEVPSHKTQSLRGQYTRFKYWLSRVCQNQIINGRSQNQSMLSEACSSAAASLIDVPAGKNQVVHIRQTILETHLHGWCIAKTWHTRFNSGQLKQTGVKCRSLHAIAVSAIFVEISWSKEATCHSEMLFRCVETDWTMINLLSVTIIISSDLLAAIVPRVV